MTTRNIIVQCKHGLHLRVASLIARVVHGQKASVFLTKEDGHKVDARSVIELVTLNAPLGTHLEITAEGPNETAVVEALSELFDHGAGI